MFSVVYSIMAEHPLTPYEAAQERQVQERKLIDSLLTQVDSTHLASSLIRAIEMKFGFWCILTSTEDLRLYMNEYLGVDWFIERGYTNPDGSELEDIPPITEEMIQELGDDMHPWRDLEEDVYPRIQANFKDTIESLFPDISK
jgi:hypothetical protein